MKHISFFCILAFLFGSCTNDWLNVKPSTALPSDDAITTEDDAMTALRGLYRMVSAHGYYGDNYIYYAEVRGEDMQCLTDGRRGESFYRFSDNPNTVAVINWSEPYKVIRQANNLITQISSGNVSGNKTDINRIKAEALALRGLALFDLTRFFGMPYTQDSLAPGVPIILKPEALQNKPARNTVAECYAQVIKDMTDALPDLVVTRTDGYINQWSVKALLSRICLYKGDNTNALKYAEMVFAPESPYSLWTHEEYPNVWGSDFTSEAIFELLYTAIENSGDEGVPRVYWQFGYNGIILTKAYLDLLGSDPNDVRHCFTSYPLDETDKKTPQTDKPRYYLTKYPGKTKTNPMDNNICVIRLSEVCLTAAETALKEGNREKALDYLNRIVSRANPNKVVTDAELTVDRILLERRKELVGEGHFFFDALRTNRTIVREGGWQLALGNANPIQPSDYRVALPIPQAEIDANPNIRQNNGFH